MAATRNSGEQQTAKWTPSLTTLLANLIVHQVDKGNRVNRIRINNTFSNKAWNFITDEFHKRSGFNWDQELLKNRFAVLRRQYAVVKSLLARDGFVFDEPTGSILATDQAWDDSVKEYPEVEDIRLSGCPIYNQLSQIFAEDSSLMTNGKRRRPPAITELSSESDDDDVVAVAVRPSRPPPLQKRRSRGVEAALANAIFEMATASKLRTNAMTQLTDRFSLAECIKELDQIHGLPENVYFAALEFFNNPSARETFLSIKSNLRLDWLRWKCKDLVQ